MLKIISAPFGDYISRPGYISTIGTYTLHPRPGRWWRVLTTVRYYPRLGAWVNNLTLRNPGIQSVAGDVSDKIISIHGFDDNEWGELLEMADRLQPWAIELNVSCPNVDSGAFPAVRFDHIKSKLIVKLPPLNWLHFFWRAEEVGITHFHCCNALPIPGGGALSGKPLKPLSLEVIRKLRVYSKMFLIGGGGITSQQDIEEYIAAGADAVAIGSGCFMPWILKNLKAK